MKSKAHSKKCLEMGVPEGLIDEQDAEDSGTVLQINTGVSGNDMDFSEVLFTRLFRKWDRPVGKGSVVDAVRYEAQIVPACALLPCQSIASPWSN